MKRLSVTLELPDDRVHPMHAAMDEGVADRARVLEANVTADEQTFLFRVWGDRDAYVSRLASLDGVVEYETTPLEDGSFYLVVRERRGELHEPMFDAFRSGDVVRAAPIEFTPGRRAEVTLAGDGAAVGAALERISDDVEVSVQRVRDGAATAAAGGVGLTQRQRAALSAAREVGYFAVPREGTIEDVAERLDCATGTASEHLRKAQAALVEATLA